MLQVVQGGAEMATVDSLLQEKLKAMMQKQMEYVIK
jgi:hypothetical protein